MFKENDLYTLMKDVSQVIRKTSDVKFNHTNLLKHVHAKLEENPDCKAVFENEVLPLVDSLMEI